MHIVIGLHVNLAEEKSTKILILPHRFSSIFTKNWGLQRMWFFVSRRAEFWTKGSKKVGAWLVHEIHSSWSVSPSLGSTFSKLLMVHKIISTCWLVQEIRSTCCKHLIGSWDSFNLFSAFYWFTRFFQLDWFKTYLRPVLKFWLLPESRARFS